MINDLKHWQYYMHLVIIALALVIGIGVLMRFIAGMHPITIFLLTLIATIIILVVFDPIAHFVGELMGWRS